MNNIYKIFSELVYLLKTKNKAFIVLKHILTNDVPLPDCDDCKFIPGSCIELVVKSLLVKKPRVKV